ncbi:hypothetical protein QIS99_29630 [Streptomyces sp. B-S-A8]|uniref:Sulfite exporter TauE/SafE family protein n=1 Tax=Streptomyces solicavernae TaxID=3043614 RepID=A0ABT6S0V4_9ACTN|nr:hypothetical protein [Streptomyces sp. B-S-A8]MDI3390321.1 hypothetical protein [Streptomyces sp. B-S-A8]
MATTMQVSPSTVALPVHAAWGGAAGLVGGIGMGIWMGIWMSVSRPMTDTAVITVITMVASVSSMARCGALVGAWLLVGRSLPALLPKLRRAPGVTRTLPSVALFGAAALTTR